MQFSFCTIRDTAVLWYIRFCRILAVYDPVTNILIRCHQSLSGPQPSTRNKTVCNHLNLLPLLLLSPQIFFQQRKNGGCTQSWTHSTLILAMPWIQSGIQWMVQYNIMWFESWWYYFIEKNACENYTLKIISIRITIQFTLFIVWILLTLCEN